MCVPRPAVSCLAAVLCAAPGDGADGVDMQGDVARSRKVLVFCGTVDSCRSVEHQCREQDVPTVCYHGDMPKPARSEAMQVFTGRQEGCIGQQYIKGVRSATAAVLEDSGTLQYICCLN